MFLQMPIAHCLWLYFGANEGTNLRFPAFGASRQQQVGTPIPLSTTKEFFKQHTPIVRELLHYHTPLVYEKLRVAPLPDMMVPCMSCQQFKLVYITHLHLNPFMNAPGTMSSS
jgi:hypothetical protein